MLGLTEAEWATVCQMYLRFFSEGQPNLPRSSVKGPLGRVFEFMFSVLRKESSADLTVPENFFNYELFTMIPDHDWPSQQLQPPTQTGVAQRVLLVAL